MSDLCTINMRPETWPNRLVSDLRINGEAVYSITYGDYHFNPYNPDMHDISGMTCLMRASVHEKLLNGEYSISPNSQRLMRLIILDKTGKMIDYLGVN